MIKPSKIMQDKTPSSAAVVLSGRRRVLEMLGMTAVALPVLGLQACGSDEGASPGATAMDKVEPAMKDVATKVEKAADSMTDSARAVADDVSEIAQGMVDDVEADTQQAATKVQTIATDAMAQLDENGPQAMGLGYRHVATTVENARYQSGQQCSNCVLFQGDSSEWGECPLFTGKQVKSTGWCSAYSAAG